MSSSSVNPEPLDSSAPNESLDPSLPSEPCDGSEHGHSPEAGSEAAEPLSPPSESSTREPPPVRARLPLDHHPLANVATHWTFLGVSAIVLLLALVLEVQGTEQVKIPGLEYTLPGVCTFRRLFGTGCPGCGLTRCFVSLAHGRVQDAWDFNPVGLFVFAVVVAQIPYRLIQLWRLHRGLKEIPFRHATNWILLVLSVGLLGQWVLRLVLQV